MAMANCFNILPSTIMKFFSSKQNTNGVNGTSDAEAQGAAPGRGCVSRQDTPDRHQATVEPTNRKKQKQRILKIGTWNVRTMLQIGKLANVEKEMERLNVDIMGIAEMRWKGSGKLTTDKHVVIYSGGEGKGKKGVGLIIKKEKEKFLNGFWPISDRVIAVRFKSQPMDCYVIQAYAPTTAADKNELEDFYNDLQQAYNKRRSREIQIVMGDFNAKVGKGRTDPSVGPWGLGSRNERGDTFVEWCEENNLIIANTWFENHKRRLYTWRSPNGKVRNQIDYICVNQRMRNTVLSCKTYPGADCGSDHVPLVTTMRVNLKGNKKKDEGLKGKYNFEEVDCDDRLQIIEKVGKLLNAREVDCANKLWEQYRECCHRLMEKFVPVKKKEKHKKWITKEILDVMEERRKAKGEGYKYSELDKNVKKMCLEAKSKYFEEKCAEIERNAENRMPRECHKNIKEATGRLWKNNKGSTGVLKNKKGEILFDKEDIMKRWEEYIKELYSDSERKQKTIAFNGELTGQSILKKEILNAIKSMKKGKACGSDNIPIEFIEMGGEPMLNLLENMFNMMYDSGELGEEMLQSVFIPLPKKNRAMDCNNYRTISLLSHTLKILLKILMNRMKKKLYDEINECQFGFMPDKGTRNAVFIVRMLGERSIEVNKDLYCCFIDFTKAFDKIQHNILFEMLSDLDLMDKDLRILQNVYFDQTAKIKINGELSKPVVIEIGVRQGCVLSPDLFSYYSEVILRPIDKERGASVGGVNITNVRFADDTVLLANSQEDLQNLLNIVQKECEKFGMEINCNKTEVMVISKTKKNCDIIFNRQQLKQVRQFKYLGSNITDDGRCNKDINCRIAEAKKSFMEMKCVLTNLKMPFSLRYRLLQCYILPIMLYGCESWTLLKSDIKRIEAAEMWFLRKMLKIKWTDKKSNEFVLKETIGRRSILQHIAKRQVSFFGHVMRKNKLENLTMTGKIEGKRSRGKQRTMYMGQIKKWTNSYSAMDVFRKAQNRTLTIANVF